MLGLQAAAAGALVDGWADALGLAVLVCASRAALVVVCRAGVPAARPRGLGAAVAGTVPTALAAAVWVVVAALLALTWVLRGGALLGGLLAAALALAAAALLVGWCRRRLGGVTGDVMGAVVEIDADGPAAGGDRDRRVDGVSGLTGAGRGRRPRARRRR